MHTIFLSSKISIKKKQEINYKIKLLLLLLKKIYESKSIS
jgi:hypothetical protein